MSDLKAAEEEAVFDRQMRLWGADAQQRIRSSKVLIRGKFQGLAAELSKNLVLAGANVELLDDALVAEDDVLTNIFLRREDIGKPRASAGLERLREMNPFATVSVATGEPASYKDYSLVVSIGDALDQAKRVAEACRASSVPFIYALSGGLLSLAVLDMGSDYKYAVENKQGEFKTASYMPFVDVLEFSTWSKLPVGRKAFPAQVFALWALNALEASQAKSGSPVKRTRQLAIGDLAKDMFSALEGKAARNLDEIIRSCNTLAEGKSFAPTCTVFGGLIGQEALKVATGQAEPLNHIVVYDGADCAARVFSLPA